MSGVQIPSSAPIARSKKRQTPPLIPDGILDVQSQRVFVISIFVLIQAWKLHDLYLMKNQVIRDIVQQSYFLSFMSPSWNFIFKYIFLDSLILWTLPVLKIPRLNYSPLAIMALIVVLSSITVGLSIDIGVPSLSIFAGIWNQISPEKELTVLEDYVKTDDLHDQSSHFRGKKTIRYLPDSSIKLNPFNENYCMSNFFSQKITVPVRFNSTSELELLQVQHVNFDNEITLLNYTKKELRRLIKGDYTDLPNIDPSSHDENVEYLGLTFKEPGYYKILQALDTKYKNIRNYKSDLIISICPSAHFSEFENTADRCMNDDLSGMSISVIGVPPLILTYSEEVNGKLMDVPNSIVSPEGFKSPLNSRDPSSGPKIFQKSELKDVSWASPQLIEVPLANRKIDQSGDFIFTVNKIIDGFGNVVEYTPDPADKKFFYKFKSHPIPVISLTDSDSSVPLINGGKKTLNMKISQTPCISCEEPYIATFNYTSVDGETIETFSKSFDFQRNQDIVVDEPGSYVLVSAASKYCPAKVGSSTVNVWKANLPEVGITADPIIDNCVGTTGYKFTFEFIGNGPYEVGYRVSKVDPNNPKKIVQTKEVKTIRSASSLFEFDYKPPSAGSYSIEFLSLSDKYYKNQVRFDKGEHRYITHFKQKPKAYFSKGPNFETKYLCNGQDTEVTLYLEGQSPFAIKYDMISPNGVVESFSISDIKENEYKIKTQSLTVGGEYIISLKSVLDNSSCDVDFKGQEAHFVVKKEIPQLSFAKTATHKLVQGKSLSIAMKHDSGRLIDLQFRRTSLDRSQSKDFGIRGANPSDGFSVSEEGIYSLVGFTEDNCPGKVVNDNEVTVSYIPKPSLSLKDTDKIKTKAEGGYVISNLCEGCSDFFTLQISGASPFVVDYSIKYPNGFLEEKSEQISTKEFTINLKTLQSGLHEYSINGVYDSIYTKETIKDLTRRGLYSFNRIIIDHTVTPLPHAIFSTNRLELTPHNNPRLHSHQNQKDIFLTCLSSLSNIDELDPIPISLTGKAPFSIKLNVYDEKRDEANVIKIDNIFTNLVNTYAIYENLNVGSYIISTLEVSDANNCVQKEFGDKNEATVIVNDVPKIRHVTEEIGLAEARQSQTDSDSSYYCVGDPITYFLSGVSPFTVFYEFDSLKQKVEVEGNVFKRRASVPGELSILALGDSSSKSCMVNFTDGDIFKTRPDLKAKVYDLPSVEISTGDSVEEDIHEGDMVEIVFTLTGHAPFKLTYVRSEPTKRGSDSQKIVEVEVVENIYGYEHRIWAKLEGTYEAIEVQDAYCVARNHIN